MQRAHSILAVTSLALAGASHWLPLVPGASSSQEPEAQESAGSGSAVQVAGVMSQRLLAREGEFGEERAFAGSLNAVRVVLEVDLARLEGAGERRIVTAFEDESKLTRFVDDKGTDLTAGIDDFHGAFEMMPSISKDGMRAAVIARTDTPAAKGASRVELEGSVALFCASKTTTADSESVALAKGTQLTVGEFAFEVTEVGEPDWGDAKMAIAFETKSPLDAVTRWTLVTDSGKELELEPSMSMTFGSTRTQTLNCAEKVEKAKLRLEYWADGEKLEVPFALQAGVGL